jgi:hypothetical protein
MSEKLRERHSEALFEASCIDSYEISRKIYRITDSLMITNPGRRIRKYLSKINEYISSECARLTELEASRTDLREEYKYHVSVYVDFRKYFFNEDEATARSFLEKELEKKELEEKENRSKKYEVCTVDLKELLISSQQINTGEISEEEQKHLDFMETLSEDDKDLYMDYKYELNQINFLQRRICLTNNNIWGTKKAIQDLEYLKTVIEGYHADCHRPPSDQELELREQMKDIIGPVYRRCFI